MIKKLTEKLIHFQDKQMCNKLSQLEDSGYVWKTQEGQRVRKFIVVEISTLDS